MGRKLLQRIAWWHEYTQKNGASMDANPSPGNRARGITTILEKSLGAVAKGGTSTLAGYPLSGRNVTVNAAGPAASR